MGMNRRTSYRNMLKEVERAVAMIEEAELQYENITERIINGWEELSDEDKTWLKAEKHILEHLLNFL